MTDTTNSSTPEAPAAPVAAPVVPLTLEQKLEALEDDVKAEFQRIRLWVETCIGSEIAKVGGKTIEE